MRVIAGKLKGRRLTAPADQSIRPTTDRVKEALFSILAPYLQDAIVIDVFSGTGGLGLEAVSRGAKMVYFGDKARSGIDLIKKNIAHCQAEEFSTVMWGTWEKVLANIPEQADIILLDPPYETGLLEECIEQIGHSSLLAPEGIIAVEHNKRQKLPKMIGGLMKYREKKYGKVVISLYTHATQEIEAMEDDWK